MSAVRWTEVCSLEDVVPGTGVCALVDGRQVAVVRVGDCDTVLTRTCFFTPYWYPKLRAILSR